MAKLRFKMKKGMGPHLIRRGGRLVTILPGDEITIEKHELVGAMDKFEQLDPDPEPKQPSVGLKLVHAGGKFWNVINEKTKRRINDKPMLKEDAQKLITGKQEEKTEEVEPEMKLKIEKVEGGFNVVNVDTGDPIHAQPLSKEAAEEMMEGLTKEKEK